MLPVAVLFCDPCGDASWDMVSPLGIFSFSVGLLAAGAWRDWSSSPSLLSWQIGWTNRGLASLLVRKDALFPIRHGDNRSCFQVSEAALKARSLDIVSTNKG
jgi:hypothetical protein